MQKGQYKETDDFRTLPKGGLSFLVIVHLCHSSLTILVMLFRGSIRILTVSSIIDTWLASSLALSEKDETVLC